MMRATTFRWLGTALLILMLLPRLSASVGPELRVRDVQDKEVSLAIDQFLARTFFFEDLAETTITITFRNQYDRVLEGEFAIPLPPGATVSGYALEVQGKMRAGVIVEKERARHAYFSIKRQLIDPGFVEREAGNVYRTKIFPIPRHGTKSVRLSWQEKLPAKGDAFQYRLPFDCTQEIENFAVFLQAAQDHHLEVSPVGGLQFERIEPSLWKSQTPERPLRGTIDVTVRPPSRDQSLAWSDGKHIYLRDQVPAGAMKASPRQAKSLHLVWDASASGANRDHEKEWAVLDELFRHWQEVEVSLGLVHWRIEPQGVFRIRQGDWSQLRQALQNVKYGGATSFSSIQSTAALTLIFSDGHTNLGKVPPWTHPVYLITSSGSQAKRWDVACRQSGGQALAFEEETPAMMAEEIRMEDPRLFVLAGAERDHCHVRGPVKAGQPLSVALRLSSAKAWSLKLSLGHSIETARPWDLAVREVSDEKVRRLIRGVWAQQQLIALESAAVVSPEAIIKHCRDYGLVSDYTSFIVLERFRDHLKYRIPPPEPDLLARYHKELAEQDQQKRRNDPHGRIVWQRQKWHQQEFPWFDHVLIKPYRRLTKWRNALVEAFAPSDVDPEWIRSFATWQDEVDEVFAQRDEARETDSHVWKNRVLQLAKKAEQWNEQRGPKTNQQNIAVSVRGLVKQPGTFLMGPDITLREAVAACGGPSALGSWLGVALYRNATKTLYNTKSGEYVPVPLRPGDMVVVEVEPLWDFNEDDPFSDDAENSAPEDRPAVVEELEGYELLNPFSGFEESRNRTAEPLIVIGREPTGTQAQLRQELQHMGKDPQLDLLSRLLQRYEPVMVYFNLSRSLWECGQKDLARLVLSNLVEGERVSLDRYRMLAYQLGAWGDWSTAESVLEDARLRHPYEKVLHWDLAWVRRGLDKFAAHRASLEQVAHIPVEDSASMSWQLEEIAIASQNRFKDDKVMDYDLRVVVTVSTGLILQPKIDEPIATRPATWYQPSIIGGRLLEEDGVIEYTIKKAVSGNYELNLICQTPQLARVIVYRNWGRLNQTQEEQLIFITPSKSRQTIASIEWTP